MSEVTSATAPGGEDGPLYVKRRAIYPQSVSGTFRTTKWVVLAATLGIYYALPFLRWHRGPDAPDQAVLIDFPARRFYFFFIEIWPQEIYYLTGLLIMAAMALFLMNAVAGRLWCGYLCPQTVWTDLFYAVERLVEGDRRERIHNAGKAATPAILGRRALKHAIWLTIAWCTGGAWVLYFADAPTLVWQLATVQAPAVAYIWIAILTFTTYTLAGFMREQVCTYMCPWPRIQAALTDEHALNVTYRYDRGEPRGSLKHTEALRAAGQPAGDCIDCDQCVAVCPTGVDIRKGLQLDCIQCGLCIDACDTVMAKVGRAPRLISYDTDINVRRRIEGKPDVLNLIRPRTLLYALVLGLVGTVMAVALVTRSDVGLTVQHDRNPLFVRLSDGRIRNGYTVRLLNKRLERRAFVLGVEGLPDAEIEIVGGDGAKGESRVIVDADRTREIRALVKSSALADASTRPITFRIRSADQGAEAAAIDRFDTPGDTAR